MIYKRKIVISAANPQKQAVERTPILPFVFLLSGVWGLLAFLRSIQGIEFQALPVYVCAGAVCLFLWFFWNHRRSILWFGMILLLAGCGAAVFALWNVLPSQMIQLAASVRGDTLLGETAITECAILLSFLLPLLLFMVEFILRRHTAAYLITTAILLLSPLLGVRIRAGALFCLLMFQGVFWMIQLQGSHRLSFSSGVSTRKHTAGTAALFFAAAFFLACLVAAVFSQELYDLAYQAEGFVYRSLSQMSGRAGDPITGGTINRGNNYRTGTIHLELSAPHPPSEPLYLREFAGGEYTGGDWTRSSDEELLERMTLESDGQEWDRRAVYWYYGLYFILNWMSYEEEPPEPISVTIRHKNGEYRSGYVPYYGVIMRGWGQNGYTYRYFEQEDMQIQWDQVRAANEEWGGFFETLQEEYMAQAADAYTQVPTELLPRLTELAEKHPLTDLNDISAFILYTLHSNASYTLTPGWAPLNEDIVEYFLFDGHYGYCQHFAAAATLLYRLYGVPARYATGYMVSPSDFDQQEDGSWLAEVTDESAHAWTEIFLPDYGWTPVEVTPAADGSSSAAYPGFTAGELEQQIWMHGWDVEPPHESGTDVRFEDSHEQSNSFFPIPDFNWAAHKDLLLVLGACLGYSILLLPLFLDYRRLLRLRKLEDMSCRIIFARLLEVLHSCGHLVDMDGSEPNFSRKLSDLIPSVTTEDAEELIEQVKNAAYGPADAQKPGVGWHVYLDTATALYGSLPWYKKWVFRYIKGY